LNELWSDSLIEIHIANPSKLLFGQEMLHGDLQGLDYDLGDRYTLNPKFKEDIEFQKGINVKLKPRKYLPSLETESISSVWTLETNTY
jgi:hypothetical protein